MAKKLYLNFSPCEAPTPRKTNIWSVWKAGSERLGYIEWCGRWRQYVFVPQDDTYWSDGCLLQIAEFLKKVNREHRLKKPNPIADEISS